MKEFPFNLVEGFTPELVVGERNRGLGSGPELANLDYAVLVRGQDVIIAEMKGAHVTTVEGNHKVDLLPHLENALLFAGAPALFKACKAAYVMLKAVHDTSESSSVRASFLATMQQLETALRAADGPPRIEPKKTEQMHQEGCGGEAGCICPIDWDTRE